MVYSSRPTFGMSRKPFNSTIPPETRPLQAEQWQLRRYLYPLPLNVQRGTTIPITKVSCHQRNITCPSLAIAFFGSINISKIQAFARHSANFNVIL